MKKFLLSVVFAASLVGGGAIAQNVKPVAGVQVAADATANNGYKYLIYLPKDYDAKQSKKWPVLIFLHGSGERGEDLNKLKVHGPPRLINEGRDMPFITISMLCPENKLYENPRLEATLKNATRGLKIDKSRLYLTGLSMGGMATWSWAIEKPHYFAAIAPIAGMANPQDAPKILDLPIWAFHGAKDDVVALQGDQDIVGSIHEIGGTKAKITIYPEANHDSWTQTYANPEFYDWLLSNVNPHPKNF